MVRLQDSKYRFALAALCFALSVTQGCVRSDSMRPDATATTGDKQALPFHPDPGSVGGNSSMPSPDAKSATGLPFRATSRARVLPAGTLLTVQLKSSLAANNVHAGDIFSASVASPLVADGDTIIERGTEVAGRVEAARSRPGSGYVRLTLSTITRDGTPIAVQTSSLFARGTTRQLNISASGTSPSRQSGGVRVPRDRRLTFRLTAPVTLNEPILPNHHQTSAMSSE
ncbi:MAG: hypothetical protein JWQ87_694 [Candidatus Sulfotelmatobacter sp.]|nr:hypothetical protein [Candidatus Sulfotelmatobacter sp.]